MQQICRCRCGGLLLAAIRMCQNIRGVVCGVCVCVYVCVCVQRSEGKGYCPRLPGQTDEGMKGAVLSGWRMKRGEGGMHRWLDGWIDRWMDKRYISRCLTNAF